MKIYKLFKFSSIVVLSFLVIPSQSYAGKNSKKEVESSDSDYLADDISDLETEVRELSESEEIEVTSKRQKKRKYERNWAKDNRKKQKNLIASGDLKAIKKEELLSIKRKIRCKKWREAQHKDPEKKKKLQANNRARQAKRRGNMTLEEQQDYIEKECIRSKQKRDQMTEEEKEAKYRKPNRARYYKNTAGMTFQEFEEFEKRRALRMKNAREYRKNMPKEQHMEKTSNTESNTKQIREALLQNSEGALLELEDRIALFEEENIPSEVDLKSKSEDPLEKESNHGQMHPSMEKNKNLFVEAFHNRMEGLKEQDKLRSFENKHAQNILNDLAHDAETDPSLSDALDKIYDVTKWIMQVGPTLFPEEESEKNI